MADNLSQYRMPYFDSNVFISWVRKPPEIIDGVNRQEIARHILTLAEQGIFEIFTSTFTLAEVYKKRAGKVLSEKDNGAMLDAFAKYLENHWVRLIDVDRAIGEAANSFCVKYSDIPIYPPEAIHLACAIRAQCEVLLTWDGPLLKVSHPDISIEKPKIMGPSLPLYDLPSH